MWDRSAEKVSGLISRSSLRRYRLSRKVSSSFIVITSVANPGSPTWTKSFRRERSILNSILSEELKAFIGSMHDLPTETNDEDSKIKSDILSRSIVVEQILSGQSNW